MLRAVAILALCALALAQFPVSFKAASLTTTTGSAFSLSQLAVIKYGPDGRLYCGATNSMIYALSVNRNLQVTKTCEKSVLETWPRAVLGIAFNPKSNALKMFFTASTLFHTERNIISNPFTGWTNGKVQSVTMVSATGCFGSAIADVVTGLPVSNHDHGLNALEFLPNGKMLIGVGGFTNGGVSVPTDSLGGFPSNALSGAIVECPVSGTAMTYSNPSPFLANVTGGACKTYATGFRNTFAMTLHTNGNLYATDNGPNAGFGDFSTNCEGGSVPAMSSGDKLHKVQAGKCHGHPSLYRGVRGASQECVFQNPSCVQPIVANLPASTNGVIEYRSNIFGAPAKGNLFLSKFAGFSAAGVGQTSRVVLNAGGNLAAGGLTQNFFAESGLSIVEGPRGELVMSRNAAGNFFVLVPDVTTAPTGPFFIGVLPRQGPAGGGTRTTVSGYNFGTAPTATFGGVACTGVQVIDDDTFSCVTPAGMAGKQVPVVVTVGTSTASGVGSDFWYF